MAINGRVEQESGRSAFRLVVMWVVISKVYLEHVERFHRGTGHVERREQTHRKVEGGRR